LLLLEEEHQRLKQAMATRVKRQLRRLPNFGYFLDDTLDEMYKVDALFDRLHAENQMPKE